MKRYISGLIVLLLLLLSATSFAKEDYFLRARCELSEPYIFAFHIRFHCRPWGWPSHGYAYLSSSGLTISKPTKENYLKKGKFSPWVNIGKYFQGGYNHIYLSPRQWGKEEIRNFNITVQIAKKPDETSIIRTITQKEGGNTFYITVPPDLTKQKIESFEEITDRTLKFLEGIKVGGKKPEKILFYTYASIIGHQYSEDVFKKQLKILSLMGINTVNWFITPDDQLLWKRWQKANKVGIDTVSYTHLTLPTKA